MKDKCKHPMRYRVWTIEGMACDYCGAMQADFDPPMKPKQREWEQARILNKMTPELREICGKHSTLWNYSKLETMEKLADLLQAQHQQTLKRIENEKISPATGDAEKYNFDKWYYEGWNKALDHLKARLEEK